MTAFIWCFKAYFWRLPILSRFTHESPPIGPAIAGFFSHLRPKWKTTKIRVGPTYFVMGGDLYPPIGGVHMGGTRVRWGGFTRESRQNWKSPKIGLKTSNKSFHRAKIAIAMTKLLLKLSICQEYGHSLRECARSAPKILGHGGGTNVLVGGD